MARTGKASRAMTFRGRCLPWRHDWHKRTGLTVAMNDLGAKGELWRCARCPATKAK